MVPFYDFFCPTLDCIVQNTKQNKCWYIFTPFGLTCDTILFIPRIFEYSIMCCTCENQCPYDLFNRSKIICNRIDYCFDHQSENKDCRNCGPAGYDCLYCSCCFLPFSFIFDIICCPCDCIKYKCDKQQYTEAI